MSLSSKVNYSLEALSGITVGNINITGNIFQNNNPYIASQWTSTSGNTLTYTSGNVVISSGTLLVSALTTGNINFTGTLSQNGSPYIGSQWTGTSGTLYYGTAGSSQVGINTTSPGATLDVSGTGRITTSLTTGSLFSTNQTSTNIVGTRISAGNFVGTTISTTNLYGSTGTISNFVSTSISAANINVSGTLTVVNITSTNLIDTNISAGTLVGTSVSVANLSASSSTLANSFISGGVGIGTTNPNTSYNLDVAGSIRSGLRLDIGGAQPIYSGNTLGRLFITGAQNSVTAGPNILITTSQDTFPTYNFLTYGHDASWTMYDMYFDGSSFRNSGTSTAFAMLKDGSTLKWNYNTSGFSAGAATPISTSICIGSGGNVGLGGQVTPAYTLDVSGGARIVSGITAGSSTFTTVSAGDSQFSNLSTGNINFTGSLFQNGSAYIGSQWVGTSGSIYYGTAGSSQVGINTTSPGATLDVSGTSRITTSLTSGALYSTNLTTTNVVGTRVSAGNFVGTTISTTNMYGSTGTISNFVGTNLSGSTLNISSTGRIATSLTTGALYSTNQTTTNIVATNISSSTLNISSPTNATSVSNGGALTVVGGAAVGGDLIVGGSILYSNAAAASSTFAYLTLTASDWSTDIGNGALVAFGGISVQNTANATSATSGNGLTIAGGAGIGADLYVGGVGYVPNVVSTNNTTTNLISSSITASNINVSGTLTVVNITSTNLVETNITVSSIIVTSGGLNATFNSNTIGSIITTGGNVGIGTTSPSAKLTVNGPIMVSNADQSIGINAYWTTSWTRPDTSRSGFVFDNNSTTTTLVRISAAGVANNVITLNDNGSISISATTNSPTFSGGSLFLSSGLITPTQTSTNAVFTNVSIGTRVGTTTSTANVYASLGTVSNFVGTNVSSTSLNATTATISTLLNTNAISTNISSGTLTLSTGITSASAEITNLNASTSTIATLLNTNAVSTNISGGTINATTINATTYSGGTISVIGITSGTIRVTGNADLSTGLTTVTDLTGTNITSGTIRASTLISTSNLSTNNFSAGTIRATTLITTSNLSTNTITVGSLLNTNAVSTNISSGTLNLSTGITAASAQVTNLVATASTITNLSIPGTLTVVNITSTNLVETNITAATILVTGGSLNATFNSNTIGNLFTTGGNVGIGTTSPNLALDIFTTTTSGHLGMRLANSGNHIYFMHNGGTAFMRAGGADFGLGFEVGGLGSGTYGGQTYNRIMTLTSIGNVGIGTTSPLFSLDINGNSRVTTSGTANNVTTTHYIGNSFGSTAVRMQGHYNGTTQIGTDGLTGRSYLQYYNDFVINRTTQGMTTASLYIDSANGNIGLNNTSPSYRLDVNGIINASTSVTTGALYSTNLTTTNIVGTNITVATIIVTSGSLNATFNSNTIGSLFTTGGNIGINTPSPGAPLHITRNVGSNLVNPLLTLTALPGADIGPTAIGGGSINLEVGESGGNLVTFNAGKIIWGSLENLYGGPGESNGLMIFQTANQRTLGNLLTLTGNQRVGINTTNPGVDLDVNGTIDAITYTGANLAITAATAGTLIANDTLSISGISSFFGGSFSANNNVSSAANVTGLLFPSATIRSFVATLTVNVSKAGGNLNEMVTLEGTQLDSGWTLFDSSLGEDTGLVFTINSSGQVQYTSINHVAWTSTTIRFEGHYYTLAGTYTPTVLATSGNVSITGDLNISSTKDATNTSSGALTISGGAGVSKSLLVGENFNVGGISNTFTGSFAAANNVAADTSVTGFLVPTATFSSFTASVNVRLLTTTTTLNAQYLFEATQTTSGWLLNDTALGDSVGLTFTITSTGQIQYTSTNVANWQSTTINYSVTAISISTGFTAVLPTSGNVSISGNLTIDSTTDSSSTSAASLVLAGGAGINKSLLVGGNFNIGGVTTQFAGTFSAANGVSAANFTGLSFANATIRSFTCTISIRVVSSTNYNTQHTIEGIQTATGGWQISDSQIGDTSGITFSINSSGQITYTSPTFTTWTSTTMHYNAVAYNISSSYTPIPMPTGGSSSVAGSLVIQGTDEASSTSSGSLSVSGGVNIQKNLIVANNMFVTSAGNVGIGTSSPQRSLHVAGQFIRLSGASGSSYGEIFVDNSAMTIYGKNAGSLILRPQGNEAIEGVFIVNTNGSALLSALQSGNVGIATTSPSSTLDINGTLKASNSNGIMLFASSGNVGIGTTVPAYTLDVNGTIDATTYTGANIMVSGTMGSNVVEIGGNEVFRLSRQTGYKLIQTYQSEPLVLNILGNNVGINTTSPIFKLDINGTMRASGPGGSGTNGSVLITGADSYGHSLYVASSSGTQKRIGFNHNGTIGNIWAYDYGSNTSQNLGLQAYGGNVGIGTTSPAVKLDVNGISSLTPNTSMYYLNYPSNGANTYLIQYPNAYVFPWNQTFYQGQAVTIQANTTNFNLLLPGKYIVNMQTSIQVVTAGTDQHYAISLSVLSGNISVITNNSTGFCPASAKIIQQNFNFMVIVTTPGSVQFFLTPNSTLNNIVQGVTYSTAPMHTCQFTYLGV